MIFYPTKSHHKRLHNGTHIFNPTVILISLDGVVNHDLDLHLTPHMSDIGKYIHMCYINRQETNMIFSESGRTRALDDTIVSGE